MALSAPLPDLIKFILDRTGYRHMLQPEKTPEAETRLENLDELINAAAEAAERGETHRRFSGPRGAGGGRRRRGRTRARHADDAAQRQGPGISHGVHFRAWKMACSRTAARSTPRRRMEEERRLCYVGMTRARKRLILTWAKYRRRFGGGEQERSTPSGFLGEVPEDLIANMGPRDDSGEMDLHGERHDVRQSARRNTFTGKTYNSLENISQFFGERGMPFNRPAAQPRQRPANPAAAASQLPRPPRPTSPCPPRRRAPRKARAPA